MTHTEITETDVRLLVQLYSLTGKNISWNLRYFKCACLKKLKFGVLRFWFWVLKISEWIVNCYTPEVLSFGWVQVKDVHIVPRDGCNCQKWSCTGHCTCLDQLSPLADPGGNWDRKYKSMCQDYLGKLPWGFTTPDSEPWSLPKHWPVTVYILLVFPFVQIFCIYEPLWVQEEKLWKCRIVTRKG